MSSIIVAMDAVQSLPLDAIDEDLLLACCRLWCLVWPREDSGPERRSRTMRERAAPGAQVHVLREGGKPLALAHSFHRDIAIDGESRHVLALASVCSDPAARGRGHARAVVHAAFARLDGQRPVCLFQTDVPAFYERLGSRRIANPIGTSIGTRAFWNPHAMIHPGGATWPEGPIDLLGPGW